MAIYGLGLDILGPFPRATVGSGFFFVAIDKFTKWPEVEGVRKVTAQSAIKFLKRLVCRFGVPARIITDNGTKFMSHAFMQFAHVLKSKISFCSVSHPRSNWQAERVNAKVLPGLKTRMFNKLLKCEMRWIDELLVVLWSLRTTPNRAIRQTPFSLVYGVEAVIPMK